MYYINLFLPFIFILGTAVVLHEFGHFIVAKLFGMRVETFSVGFGPRLFGRLLRINDARMASCASKSRRMSPTFAWLISANGSRVA